MEAPIKTSEAVEHEAWRRFLALHDYFIVRHPPVAIAFSLAYAYLLPSSTAFFRLWVGPYAVLTLAALLGNRSLQSKEQGLALRRWVYQTYFVAVGLLTGVSLVWTIDAEQLSRSAVPVLGATGVAAMLMTSLIPARRTYLLMTFGMLVLPGLWLLRLDPPSAFLGAAMIIFSLLFLDQQRRFTATHLDQIGIELERLALLEALRERSRDRAHLIAALAHDLRQPINAQRIALTAMQQRLPKEAPTLGLLLSNTATLAAEVDALLDLGRSESGALTPKLKRFKPAAFLKDLVKNYDAEIRARKVRLSGRYEGPSALFADPAFLRRILGNLIENGLRHARSRIDIRLSAKGKELRVRVADDGEGIPASLRPRIFEPYISASSDDLPHWGLGLYSARELVRAQSGDLILLPTAKGTVFEARLQSGQAPHERKRARPSSGSFHFSNS